MALETHSNKAKHTRSWIILVGRSPTFAGKNVSARGMKGGNRVNFFDGNRAVRDI